ncbi:PAAR domain-containing protein [Neisseria sp. Dent CA1/247]|uniref:PAAR domain-containing protein n=1 Tax=Neisseria sp. Dent CA1/247 TaxID=2912675 RepID=UPI001FD2BCD3|nr:PAAR domain-containing protein [Neisseria sp. Dent CA1/247]UOO76372.1 PAAR domain-containing protein [Neisseria sp. Dent CA1/247]
MEMKSAIIEGDMTTHGGYVLTGSSRMTVNGKQVALSGDPVSCPKCKGVFHIVEGGYPSVCDNKSIAFEGMLTTCGAKLIGSQTQYTLAVESSHISTDTNPTFTNNSPAEETRYYDEQVILDPEITEGIPYFIETDEGKTYYGIVSKLGKLPRVATSEENSYTLYLGDEALAKQMETQKNDYSIE